MDRNRTWRLIELPSYLDPRGNLSVIEGGSDIPFEVVRCHWIYDVPGGGAREGHAFKQNSEFIVALSGSFDVLVDDGQRRDRIQLNRSYYGLYLPSGVWREIDNFSTNSVAMVLSSTPYNEDDYINDYAVFKSAYTNPDDNE